MDSKLVKDSLLGNLVLKSYFVVAAVKDIPGASISAGNVVLDLSKFSPSAQVVFARCANEIATITQTAGVTATLDTATAMTAASVLELAFSIKLGE